MDTEEILSILDDCCEGYTFPMLDNGNIYLAATRLSLYRSITDWAIVIEVFGYSPRAAIPETFIQTFASQLFNRDKPDHYINRQAYEVYLENNPYNEFRSILPIADGPWLDASNVELVSKNGSEIVVRGQPITLPAIDEYTHYGIELEQYPRVQVFELCRFLAEIGRDQVLATPQERRISVMPDMIQLLQLEEWHHPNVANNELPSDSETFQQLAKVLSVGDASFYHPSKPPNTHWKFWPDGGCL